MARRIDTQANIPSIRLAEQVSNPAVPDNGYWNLYVRNGGLFLQNVSGSFGVLYSSLSIVEPPNSADFSWFNQGSGTYSSYLGGIELSTVNANNSGYIYHLEKDILSAPYTLTVAIILSLREQYNGAGLSLRQSSDGKVVTFGFQQQGGSVILRADKWVDSNGTYSAFYNENISYISNSIMFLRIMDDSINRIFSYSPNGVYFTDVHSVSRTDFITPDKFGFYVKPTSSTIIPKMLLLSWVES